MTIRATGRDISSDVRYRGKYYSSDVPFFDSDFDDSGKEKGLRSKEKTTFEKYEPVIAPLIFTALSLFTHLYRIGLANRVIWDEAHFGKFGSYYLRREFYHDVHPPLGKMLVGLSGYLGGYNGSFDFTSGQDYPEYVSYVFMRIFNALFGVFTVPVAYYTAKDMGFSIVNTWLITTMVLCENSLTTISRFILLDSMLLFFTCTTFWMLMRFHRIRKEEAFTFNWWITLTLLGISIGCVCSVKWVGMFVMALVGVYTLHELWDKFGDLDMPLRTYTKHWVARIYCLLFIPFVVYATCFRIHFAILNHSGTGDANMSSLFQANLIGSGIGQGPQDVAFGSKITLKNTGFGGGLLHSHVQAYPEGSKQQQVTCYHHKDANNDWMIQYKIGDVVYHDGLPLQYLKDGDRIRLTHMLTGRSLHSHNIAAPVTSSQWEVSGYGNMTVGDEKDDWIVEVYDDIAGKRDGHVHALSTTFRLKHAVLGCYLRANNANLPQWGFKQIEVTCDPKSRRKDSHTHWNVENHENDRLPTPEGGHKPIASPFWRDFIHLNYAMMITNNALVPDPDKNDELASAPWQWPTLNVGLRMCSWGDTDIKYFLLGNPAIVWPATASIIFTGLATLWYLLRWQRSYKDLSRKDTMALVYNGIYTCVAWFFHYFPFVVMARVTYVHHYLPALYFSIFVYVFIIDHFTSKYFNKYARITVYAIVYFSVIAAFIIYSPITFGLTKPSSEYSYLNLIDTWRI